MKHPQYQRHRKYGVEWIQAIFTLFVLMGIYMSTWRFDSYETSLSTPPSNPIRLVSSYWNETMWYGFVGMAWEQYVWKTTSSSDTVHIKSGTWLIYDDNVLKVSFYPQASIDDIEQYHISNSPRTYSRLPNGIAVIEWDLASPRAKTILATLHSR